MSTYTLPQQNLNTAAMHASALKVKYSPFILATTYVQHFNGWVFGHAKYRCR